MTYYEKNKEYYEKNKERIRSNSKIYYEECKDWLNAKAKIYYKENREKVLARRNLYRKKNKEKIAAYAKRYHEKNKEKISAMQKTYRKENRALLSAKAKIYYKENKEKVSAKNKRYREKRYLKEEIMKCLKCNKTQFIEQKVRFTPEIKGETLEVLVPCMVCENCESPFMDTKQMSVLRRYSADKYKENHNLLTSSQIIAYREELRMSQSVFARYLGVGEASVKRWETYYIQDTSQNELIRLKCDES